MFELEWDDALERAETVLPPADETSHEGELHRSVKDSDHGVFFESETRDTPEAGDHRDLRLASIYPVDAVVLAFSRVEAAFTGAMVAEGYEIYPSNLILSTAAQLAAKLGILTPEQAETFEDLRRLRNQSVYALDANVTADEASRYVLVAERLTKALNKPRRVV